jgi:hypothetical protein
VAKRPWLYVVSCLLCFFVRSYERLDGGCAAEDGRSSSLARLVLRLLGPAPRFAEDMLDRNGELDVVRRLKQLKRGAGARLSLPLPSSARTS